MAWAEQYKAKAIAQTERDYAIKTKAWISDKKTATAMAKASVATRRANKLADALGEGKNYKQIKAIDWLKDYFDLSKSGLYSVLGRTLSKFSRQRGYKLKEIETTEYGAIKNYPSTAIAQFKYQLDTHPELLAKYRKFNRRGEHV